MSEDTDAAGGDDGTGLRHLRVHRRTRDELREMCATSDTYSDVLADVLPAEATDDAILSMSEDDMTVISVSPEIHELATELAGEGVPVRRAIDYYLIKHRLGKHLQPADVLRQTYHNDRDGVGE